MLKLKAGKKSGLKYFNMADLRSWSPCYDPIRHLKEDFRGTAATILKNESIPLQDRLWVVLRTDLVSERVLRLFAVWSYRQTLAFVTNPDPRSVAAANVAERFANGQATLGELRLAREAAYSASSAAYSAADSASSAADSAAYSAADSASSAADSAARSAANSANSAYWAARSAQVAKLLEMIVADGLENRKAKK